MEPIRHFENATKVRQIRTPKYLKHIVFSTHNGQCLYCACALQSKLWGTVQLIPRSMGGMKSSDNLAPACRSCIAKHANSDVIGVLRSNPALPKSHIDKVLALRSSVLTNSSNHLTQLSKTTPVAAVRDQINRRGQQERAVVFVHHGASVLMCLCKKSGSTQRVAELAVLFRMLKGVVVAENTSTGMIVFSLDHMQFNRVVWALIENNVLLREVQSHVSVPFNDPTNWRTYWNRTYINPQDNARRRGRGERPAPSPVKRAYSAKPGAVRARRHYRKRCIAECEKKLQAARDIDLKYLAGLSINLEQRNEVVMSALKDFLKEQGPLSGP